MKNEYINLIATQDSGIHVMNMNMYPAVSYPMINPVPPQRIAQPALIESSYKEEHTKLSDFDVTTQIDDSILKKTALWVISQIKSFDSSNLDKYSVYFDCYSDKNCSVGIYTTNNPTSEYIQRFSFGIDIYNDIQHGEIAKIYLNSLFVNQKYIDVGTTLLNILKSALKTMVNILQLGCGIIELYSVETAVLFYIKNGFIVRDLFYKLDPQTKVEATHKMIHFAMKEQNIEIMKKYAQVNQDNFLEFIQYLLDKSKYGQYFKAYFETLDNPNEIEKSVIQSRFISSLFHTNMLYLYFRDASMQKVALKPLTI